MARNFVYVILYKRCEFDNLKPVKFGEKIRVAKFLIPEGCFRIKYIIRVIVMKKSTYFYTVILVGLNLFVCTNIHSMSGDRKIITPDYKDLKRPLDALDALRISIYIGDHERFKKVFEKLDKETIARIPYEYFERNVIDVSWCDRCCKRFNRLECWVDNKQKNMSVLHYALIQYINNKTPDRRSIVMDLLIQCNFELSRRFYYVTHNFISGVWISPVHAAVLAGDSKLLYYLIEDRKVSCDLLDSNGKNPLQKVIELSNGLSKKKTLNKKQESLQAEYVSMAYGLVGAGARVDCVFEVGWLCRKKRVTAVDYAQNKAIKNLLQQKIGVKKV